MAEFSPSRNALSVLTNSTDDNDHYFPSYNDTYDAELFMADLKTPMGLRFAFALFHIPNALIAFLALFKSVHHSRSLKKLAALYLGLSMLTAVVNIIKFMVSEHQDEVHYMNVFICICNVCCAALVLIMALNRLHGSLNYHYEAIWDECFWFWTFLGIVLLTIYMYTFDVSEFIFKYYSVNSYNPFALHMDAACVLCDGGNPCLAAVSLGVSLSAVSSVILIVAYIIQYKSHEPAETPLIGNVIIVAQANLSYNLFQILVIATGGSGSSSFVVWSEIFCGLGVSSFWILCCCRPVRKCLTFGKARTRVAPITVVTFNAAQESITVITNPISKNARANYGTTARNNGANSNVDSDVNNSQSTGNPPSVDLSSDPSSVNQEEHEQGVRQKPGYTQSFDEIELTVRHESPSTSMTI